jgi:hypothetical protein
MWVAQLNGVNLGGNSGPPVDQIQVNAHGQAFLHRTDQGWQTWEAWAMQPSAGPTSGAIPIDMNFSPSFGTPLGSSPIGTLITTVSVTTSNGSPFTGTLSINDAGNPPGDLGLSGMNIVTLRSPLTGGGQVFVVTATQNGCTYTGYFDINAS